MHYRALGRTGFTVSEIGLGCNRLGESGESDAHWIGLVKEAVARGVTLFDSSESYGWGRSEEILGQAIGNDPNVLVASKVSRVHETNAKDFSAARIVRQLEGTLRRLKRDRVDIYQLHSPSLEDLQSFDWSEALVRLKADGKIGLIGVSINDARSGEWLIAAGLADVLQVPYNLLEPGIARIFPAAEAAGVGILVRVPMAQGILTGKFRPGETVANGHRAHLAGEKMSSLIERADRVRALVGNDSSLTLGQFALRYCLSPRAVSAAIPGARSVEQLAQNIAASNGRGLDEAELAEVARLTGG
jgi:aryl-alcohol dehydrogenase-like predicted oxidoreductase